MPESEGEGESTDGDQSKIDIMQEANNVLRGVGVKLDSPYLDKDPETIFAFAQEQQYKEAIKEQDFHGVKAFIRLGRDLHWDEKDNPQSSSVNEATAWEAERFENELTKMGESIDEDTAKSNLASVRGLEKFKDYDQTLEEMSYEWVEGKLDQNHQNRRLFDLEEISEQLANQLEEEKGWNRDEHDKNVTATGLALSNEIFDRVQKIDEAQKRPITIAEARKQNMQNPAEYWDLAGQSPSEPADIEDTESPDEPDESLLNESPTEKTSWLPKVLSSVVEQLKRLPELKDKVSQIDIKKVAGELYDRASEKRIFGQPVVDMIGSGALGYSTRTATRAVLAGVGVAGFLPVAAVGAVGGGSAELLKRVMVERRGYKEFTQKLTQEFEELTTQEYNPNQVGTLVKRFHELESQGNQEKNGKMREPIDAQIRYLGVYMKRRETGKGVINAYFESWDTEVFQDQIEAEKTFKSIEDTKFLDRGKLRWALGRGGARGAAFALLGGVGAELAQTEWGHSIISQAGTKVSEFASGVQNKIPFGVKLPGVGGNGPPSNVAVDAVNGKNPDFSGVKVPGVGEHVDQAGTRIFKAAAAEAVNSKNPDISASVSAMSEVVKLESGSNPWGASDNYLRGAFKAMGINRTPTFEEIMVVDKALCKASGVAVPNWDIEGKVLHTRIPVGYELKFDDSVKKVVTQIQDGKFNPAAAARALDTGSLPSSSHPGGLPNAADNLGPKPGKLSVSLNQDIPGKVNTPGVDIIPSPKSTIQPVKMTIGPKTPWDVGPPSDRPIPIPSETPPQFTPKPLITPVDIKPSEVTPIVDIHRIPMDVFTDPSYVYHTDIIPLGVKTTLAKIAEEDLSSITPYPHLPIPKEMMQKAAVQLARSSGLDYLPNAVLPGGAKIVKDLNYNNIVLSMFKDTSILPLNVPLETITTGERVTSFYNEAARALGIGMGRVADNDDIIKFAQALRESSGGKDIYQPFKGTLRFDMEIKRLFHSLIEKTALKKVA